MRVIVHAREPEIGPADIGLQDSEPELGEALQDPTENIVCHGYHVIHGKADHMVKGAEKLSRAERPEWRGPYMARLAMNRNREVEIAGQLPQGVVFRFVQPFARGQKGIPHRYRAELLHRAARLHNHSLGIAAW